MNFTCQAKSYILWDFVKTYSQLTCCFFFFGLLFLRGLCASEFELKLLLWPVLGLEELPALKEGPLLLLDVLLLDIDISASCVDDFLLDEYPNLDWACIVLEEVLVDDRGGGIRALAEFCLYTEKRGEGNRFKQLNNSMLSSWSEINRSGHEPDSFHH